MPDPTKNWTTSRVAQIGGVCGMILGGFAVFAKVGEHVNLPERVKAVEETSKALAAGQQDLARRVDVMGTAITSLGRDVDKYATRMDSGFTQIIGLLAQIGGTLGDVRNSGTANQRDIVALKAQTDNALVKSDEAYKLAAELKAKTDK